MADVELKTVKTESLLNLETSPTTSQITILQKMASPIPRTGHRELLLTRQPVNRCKFAIISFNASTLSAG